MCGIAGIAGSVTGPGEEKSVEDMVSALERRGPDDSGVHKWDSAVFGHRRLSVFDLSAAGRQPMISASGRTGIVFNGAIYNFRELAKELEAAGRRFKSSTDTEVLLEGFEEWGIESLLSKIEGMFAFAIWDEGSNVLHLVRDRLGVKPLNYVESGSSIAFASTARALKSGGFCGGVSETGLVEFLEFGFVTDSNSIYEGVKKVPPASCLTFADGKISLNRYWRSPVRQDESITFETAVEETERLFLKAVEKRLHADVAVGALLSGGIDSSLVCWAIAKLGGDVTAFTVGVPGDEWDESGIAKNTASALGIKHELLELSGGTPLDAAVLSDAYAEPFATASALGLIDVSREVRKHATVLLTGDGGDDVFLGYPEHLHFKMAGTLADVTPEKVGSIIRGLSEILPDAGSLKRAKSFLSYAYGGLGGITRARDGLPAYRKSGLLGAALKDASFPDRSIPMNHGEGLLSEFLEYDLKTRFTGEYLTKVDGGTMYHALEARSPFLDTELWSFAASIPFGVRMHKRTSKAVLREIVKRRIGPELAAGAKKGFGVPVQRWLTKEWNTQFRESMINPRVEALGFINKDAVLKSLSEAEQTGWAPRQLWFVQVLENWLRHEGI